MHHPWGGTQPHTPNTNALAAKSLIFDRAYCQQAVCGPSRASLLSGRRPDSTQMWNFVGSFRDTPGASSWNTWPQWFRRNGYYTAGCGKLWHPGNPANFDPPSWTGDQYGGYNGQGNCPVPQQLKPSSKTHGCPVPDTPAYANATFPDIETMATARQQLANAAANRAVPFWIGVGFVKPHMPHVFPAKYLEQVPQREQIDLPSNPVPPPGVPSLMDWYSGAGANGPTAETPLTPADNWTVQDWRQNYYAAAAFSDDLLGELLDELDGNGFTNNTIVIMVGGCLGACVIRR